MASLDVSLRRRVVIENVLPSVDDGRFPIARTVGERVIVRADVFADGHDSLAAVLLHRPDGSRSWQETAMVPLGNDRWQASFVVEQLATYEYTVEGWIDRFTTWRTELGKKVAAGQSVTSELLEGAELVKQSAATEGGRAYADRLRSAVEEIGDQLRSAEDRVAAAMDAALLEAMAASPDRREATRYDRVLRVRVERERARFGSWYEMFPRSAGTDPSRSATFAEAAGLLPYVSSMGFDVLYLPPIHPIGRSFRKGRNNSLQAGPDDVGSPWAIGAEAGGHTAIEPGLGTLDDFAGFVAAAKRHGLEIALDIAFQASPDHPWVREHPEWFRHRPDGSIKYAENPPKKYQDIYPLDFDSKDTAGLWQELKRVFLFWAGHGVTIFRVDNPHTKSFRFWEWCIADVKREYPEAIFLSEAFTRPKVMRYLAKAGFTQSYTYFTWRNSALELREYLTELTTTEVREYMRPNFFANTPDILHEYLQHGGRPAFEVRLVLAATLAASYGIYSGYELCENVAVRPGSEEYLDSEKYQIRIRDWNAPGNITELIGRVNRIRREYPALQFNDGLQFHNTDNPALLWFSKSPPAGPLPAESALRSEERVSARPTDVTKRAQDRAGLVFVVANTDPHNLQHGWIEMPIAELGLAPDSTYVVEDLLDGARYTWRGAWNYVRLDPADRMAHIMVILALTK